METRRIFAAIDISDEARDAIAEHSRALKQEFGNLRVRWERPEKYHVTLRFEAAADAAVLASIESLMKSVANEFSPFELTIDCAGSFENRRGPTVLWIGFRRDEGFDKLADLATKLHGAGRKTGKFHPHITIARIKRPEEARGLIVKHNSIEFKPVSFRASEIVLIESSLTPTGSEYQVLMKVPFTNSLENA